MGLHYVPNVVRIHVLMKSTKVLTLGAVGGVISRDEKAWPPIRMRKFMGVHYSVYACGADTTSFSKTVNTRGYLHR